MYERVFVDDATELVAVFEPASQPLSLETDYAAVLRTPGAEGTEGVAVWVRGGRIVHVEHDCGNFEGLYADDRVASFVVTPS